MDADRAREAMTDAGIDREMQALLAVDPSPEFAARVRARIAVEPPRSPWLAWWPLVAAAAIAIAIVAGILARPRPIDAPQWLAATPLPNAPIGVARALQGRHIADVSRPVPPVSEAPADRQSPGDGGQGRQAIDRAPVASDVLLDPRETAALRALIAGVREGRVDLQPVLRASTVAPMALAPVTAIAIPLITIDPLEQGVRQ